MRQVYLCRFLRTNDAISVCFGASQVLFIVYTTIWVGEIGWSFQPSGVEIKNWQLKKGFFFFKRLLAYRCPLCVQAKKLCICGAPVAATL